jgi:hypothetical protein
MHDRAWSEALIFRIVSDEDEAVEDDQHDDAQFDE